MQKITLTLAAVLVSLGLAQSATAAGGVVKFAFVGPQTGPVAQYGDMASVGVDAAVAAINKAGGVGGDKLEAVRYDDACDPKQAVAVANRIVREKIRFVVGHLCSGPTQAASDVYEDEGILMITPSSTAPGITARGYKLVFRTIGLDSMQSPVAGKFIAEKFKGKNIAILHDKQQYGEGMASAVRKELEARGVKVALYEGLNAGGKDYSAVITKLKRANIDFVYFGGYHPEMGTLLRQAGQTGLKLKFMGPEGVGNKEISAMAGPYSQGMLVTFPRLFENDARNKALVDSIRAAGQDPANAFVMPAYTAVQVLAEGIAKAGRDPAKVAEALRAGSFDTPIGHIGFDAKGDLKNFEFVVYEWQKDGSKIEAR